MSDLQRKENLRMQKLLGAQAALKALMSRYNSADELMGAGYGGGSLNYTLNGGAGNATYMYYQNLMITLYSYNYLRENGQHGVWVGYGKEDNGDVLPEPIHVKWSRAEIDKLYKTQNQTTLF